MTQRKYLRLHTPEQFKRAFKGRKTVCPGLVIYCMANDQPHARLGMVVKKKDFKKAVDRNRIRRVIRAQFYGLSLVGYDVVVLVRAPLEKKTSVSWFVHRGLECFLQKLNKSF